MEKSHEFVSHVIYYYKRPNSNKYLINIWDSQWEFQSGPPHWVRAKILDLKMIQGHDSWFENEFGDGAGPGAEPLLVRGLGSSPPWLPVTYTYSVISVVTTYWNDL